MGLNWVIIMCWVVILTSNVDITNSGGSGPASFDCPMRDLILEYAQFIQPFLSKDKLQAAKDLLFQKPANEQLELSAMSATADIVNTYLQHSDRLKPDQLVKLVGRVQEALLGNF